MAVPLLIPAAPLSIPLPLMGPLKLAFFFGGRHAAGAVVDAAAGAAAVVAAAAAADAAAGAPGALVPADSSPALAAADTAAAAGPTSQCRSRLILPESFPSPAFISPSSPHSPSLPIAANSLASLPSLFRFISSSPPPLVKPSPEAEKSTVGYPPVCNFSSV
ncbi:unnamed protein product [Closterium sp. NIES-54]